MSDLLAAAVVFGLIYFAAKKLGLIDKIKAKLGK